MSGPRPSLHAPLFPPPGSAPVEWVVSPGLTGYEKRWRRWRPGRRIAAGRAPERVWLLEHPPLYTAGTSAKPEDLLDPRFPVFRAGRGGQFTYHGPGQRVAYVMLDLKRRRPDVRAYVAALEGWLIDALKAFDVAGRDASGPGRRLGRPSRQAARARRGGGRGQDRRDRRARAPLGDLPWGFAQRRAGSHAFLRHRALRHSRPLWRDEPRRSRPRGGFRRRRQGVARRVRDDVRPDGRDSARRPAVSASA